MKNQFLKKLGLALLVLFGFLLPGSGKAEVSVNINIPLPGFVFPAPPGLIVIPGTYVYYPPDASIDVFFFRGSWYRSHRGGWYIANGYNGPWRTVGPRSVPRAIVDVPHGYRRMSPGHERMPYGHVKKNWQSWERERYWDNAGRGKSEKYGRDDHGHGGKRGRGDQGGDDRGRGRGHGNGKHKG